MNNILTIRTIFFNLMNLANKLITKLKSTMTNDIDQLIGIPLQTKMIAEIYCDIINSEKDLNSIELNNISDLYHEFVERKFNIHYEDKKKIEIARDMDDYEEKKAKFYEGHIKYSILLLFKENNQIDCNNDKEEKRIKCKT